MESPGCRRWQRWRAGPPTEPRSLEDVDPGLPRLRNATAEDISGRGIAIVEELSDRWGVEELGAGKITWAELDATAADGERTAR